MEVALAGDAGDQEGWNVLSLRFGELTLFGSSCCRCGELQHEGAFLGVFQRRLNDARDKILNSSG